MAKINFASIDEKFERYVKSSAGQKRIKDKLTEYRNRGVTQTAAGSVLLTEKRMREAANILIELLQEQAAAEMLPQSVRNHFDSLRAGEIEHLGKDYYEIPIYFDDDLSRPSLLITSGDARGKRTGGGVENIVSLFDTGYKTDKQVRGVWDSHSELGDIGSKTERQALYFIEKAVSRFNSYWAEEYRSEAVIVSDGKFYSALNSPLIG